jgi:ABC-type antimicrobial peptide transport system permease subunit
VRGSADAASLAAPVRAAVRELDPSLSLFNIRTLDEQVSNSLNQQRMTVMLLGGLGVLALLLAAIGLYGVVSFSVAQRTREIGVRMALGARPVSVLTLVLTRGMVLVGVGLAIGLTISLAGAGLMKTLIASVGPRDPITFVSTAAALGAIALVASYIPARRATRIDPLIALRTE